MPGQLYSLEVGADSVSSTQPPLKLASCLLAEYLKQYQWSVRMSINVVYCLYNS